MMKNLSLYIHIPFCIRKCTYCDFLSFGVCKDELGEKNNDKISKKIELVTKEYVNALLNEIKYYGNFAKGYVVKTVFIGGGTPSILLPADIAKIMGTIKSSFNLEKKAEITIEVNPGTLTREKAAVYRSCGINRMSIGLQSANNRELKLLGRIHNYDQFAASFALARQAGFDNINIDLMSSIPEQTFRSYLETLDRVLRLKPEHISSYSLIVEPGTPLSENKMLLDKLPGEDTDREMYEVTKKLLQRNGYFRYEISNYAKKGYECKHNMVYWTLGEYLGFGLGASSFFQGKRFSVETNMDLYLKNIAEESFDLLHKIDEEVNADKLMEEYMFLGLRCMEGVSAEEFHKRFGKSMYSVYGEVIEKYVKSGHLTDYGGIISLTDKGIDVSNVILADFLI